MTRRLRLAVAASAVVALAILAVGFTIYLDDDDPTADAGPFEETRLVDGVDLRVVALPGTAGPTDIHLYATAAEGEIGTLTDASAVLHHADHEIDVPLIWASTDHWIADDVAVDEPGDWELAVEIQRDGDEALRTSFTIPISEAA